MFENLQLPEEKLINEAIETALVINKASLPVFTDKFKYSHSENNFYPATENVEWTTGFWTGELWLSYELSHDEAFKKAALVQVDSFLERIEKKIDVEHHDMGFLYSPSCVAAWKLVGSETGRKAALLAADNLVSRFQEKGQFIQAWGPMGAEGNYRLIIDCLLNLPLLFWATKETGNEHYAEVATKHLKTAVKYVLRPDDSTYHTYFFDPETGKPIKGVTAQGYKDGSAWARGQAWGIYGCALAYRYLKDEEYLSVFRKVTNYFLEHLPEDIIPYWDFTFTNPSTEPRDTSALAIAICGMMEMSAYNLPESKELWDTSMKLLGKLIEQAAVKSEKKSDGLLLHSTYARKSPYNTVRNRGVDECNIWGDYYYLEALRRAKGEWNTYW